MKDLEKKYSAADIESAKAWVRNECGAMSEEGFEKAVKQVLEMRETTHVIKLDGAVPLNMYGGPTPKVELLDPEPAEEPLLNLDNVRKMPEMQKPDLSFEDRVTNRLMLAMARGEIVLALDGTPEGKAHDAKVVKDYLTREAGYYPYETRDQWLASNGGVTSDGHGSLWFEYPGDGMSDINPPRPSEKHATDLLDKLPARQLGQNVDFADIAPSDFELLGIDPSEAKPRPVFVEVDISKLAEGDSYITPDGKSYTKVHGRMVPSDAVQTALSSIHLDRPASPARQEMFQRHVDLKLEDMKLSPADEATGFEKAFRERHPDLHRGLPPGHALKVTPIKNDDK